MSTFPSFYSKVIFAVASGRIVRTAASTALWINYNTAATSVVNLEQIFGIVCTAITILAIAPKWGMLEFHTRLIYSSLICDYTIALTTVFPKTMLILWRRYAFDLECRSCVSFVVSLNNRCRGISIFMVRISTNHLPQFQAHFTLVYRTINAKQKNVKSSSIFVKRYIRIILAFLESVRRLHIMHTGRAQDAPVECVFFSSSFSKFISIPISEMQMLCFD